MTVKTYKYQKGDRPHLDEVYEIISMIPDHAYHQDDIADNKGGMNPENDSGESILFLKNVTIKVDIKVT